VPDATHPPIISYRRQWLLTFLIALGIWYAVERPPIHPPGPTIPAVSNLDASDRYFIVRLPEAPADATAATRVAERLDQWLFALKKAGFRPLRLSEVWQALTDDRPIPAKGVVLVFEPGMRRSYETLGPVLARHKWPAVWIMDRHFYDHPDPTYMSPHALAQMQRSGLWELGFVHAAAENFVLDFDETHRQTLSRLLHPFTWRNDVPQALNRGLPGMTLNRLNANVAWTGEQLVGYLLSEVPVVRSARLTYHAIYHRLIGRAVEDGSGEPLPAPFDLEPNPESRATALSWPSTRGIEDYDLHLRVNSWVGELWLLLGTQPETHGSVRVGFKEGAVVVRDDRLISTALAKWPLPSLNRGPLDVWIRCRDHRLILRVNGSVFPLVDIPAMNWSEEGILGFYIQDKVRGAAQAQAVALDFVRLPPFESRTR
jgi:hypothetical protein